MHVNEYIVKWMKSYLLDREQFVGIEGCSSASLPVLSGVPQGSVLGPLLFISYINLVTEVISQDSNLNMFANNDYTLLQNDVNAVSTFMNSRLLQFNVTKCKFMFVSKKTSRSLLPPALHLNGTLLQQVPNYKYLGLTLSDDLSWHPHITTICITKQEN